jgi:hypothetical protein
VRWILVNRSLTSCCTHEQPQYWQSYTTNKCYFPGAACSDSTIHTDTSDQVIGHLKRTLVD